ncbi:hypothetical protein J1N35_015095 [Gossypium stocksii]|uniref:Uncharacterized protein n=1 Tax=Gossypium stocksii TaxID=47602 RepID=A0A9D3VY42_9ROSI|nr:hypothetical protein J1N35_015095 [Gossypium stocksii]
MVVDSSRAESDANINLITAPTNTGIAGDVGTVRSSGSDSEKTTITSWEINEAMEIIGAMDLRVVLKAQCKKCRIDARAINVVISYKEETNNGRIESHLKKRVGLTGPSNMMATTLVSPLTSSQTMVSTSC